MGCCLQGDDPINAKVSAAYDCGQHHSMTGKPCKDRAAGFVRGALAGVVLCDGAGSCAHSERAAQRLMEWIPDYLQITFDTLCALPPEECYCTLLFYAAHADGRWLCGHIGDGYIFRIRQDTAVVFSAPENGHAINETYFLSEPGAAQHLRIRSGELHEPYAVLLTSDGGGDTLFDRQQQQPAPAVERLCDWLTENDEKTVTEALAHVIKEKMIPATEDDVSVAILYCSEDE